MQQPKQMPLEKSKHVAVLTAEFYTFHYQIYKTVPAPYSQCSSLDGYIHFRDQRNRIPLKFKQNTLKMSPVN